MLSRIITGFRNISTNQRTTATTTSRLAPLEDSPKDARRIYTQAKPLNRKQSSAYSSNGLSVNPADDFVQRDLVSKKKWRLFINYLYCHTFV
ncbi:hypothetical protein PHYBLDRAFT_180006 [Phycomyces blakesleeanus NRRL 1555(-)]|uniref:Uncharacterized protein n=1 Tax=Phycomyces blakesleeanus (strain ATCC 8743b / DSM 1359 / FGSC 10004 / NBRC 33097 / NRRL 1555) TaxID=763407 RepID=A0A162Y154_PHYB8|nr:hypothetical protein PHYBLDRAFT_180006 [Phycomyces blakesleeanus NRRL 1555(-)]OAD77815.1 hypothetical protein PHYBLDRAFT_180006 [Phycomyces blakesleeanus NRRL 1555(-)]|eukprot:XP_018295855.1 hypothetical protein PHYBLDRAFT_180006 [Phycomyces blakesleeanus NRRL 1555(-)]